MDEARALLDSGGDIVADPSLTHVVWAREQRSGRGRRGRAWVSPPGNLYTTVATALPVPLAKAPQCSFVACLALQDALIHNLPSFKDEIALKWPNDVLISGAKIAGLLLETFLPNNSKLKDQMWILIGCGVNVQSAPEYTAYPVTCLRDHMPSASLEALFPLYLKQLAHRLEQWRVQGFQIIRRDWLQKAYRLGETIQVRDPTATDRRFDCVFETVSEDGALIVLQEGRKRQLDVAEIIVSDPGLQDGSVG